MTHKLPRAGVVLAILTVLSLPAAIPAAAKNDWALLRLSAATAELQPNIDAAGYTLRVRMPDGAVVEQSFGATETPSFSLFDLAGQARPDGTYRYELIAAPRLSAEAAAALVRSRERGDDASLAALRATGQLGQGRVQSGTFTVLGGTFVAPAEVEPRPATRSENPTLATRDQVIPDDLIVQGSVCVGFDCINNEPFSFDTVRLKENNTRLTFIDTSAAGFPQGDWQVRANPSAGTANELAFDWLGTAAANGDAPATSPLRIEGAAPTSSVFVDSTGRVGFRTSTPVLDLHVATSNTPGIRLEQTAAGGFSAQTWDIAGNEANFFVRDVTGGSRLPFRIRPGAPTSSVDIAADGDVGIGTASPATKLNVVGGDVQVDVSANGGVIISSVTDGILPQLTLIEPTRTFRFRVNNPGDFVFTDATAGVSPFRIQGNAGANDRLVVTTTGVDVTGTLRVNGTPMTVPDYVFEPDYSLMPIEELASFIAANKHLPEVPNAADIQDHGLDLSTFPLTLLKKVEELTLYTVNQHETIEALNARIAALEQLLQAAARP